jgi:hypothetical protein
MRIIVRARCTLITTQTTGLIVRSKFDVEPDSQPVLGEYVTANLAGRRGAMIDGIMYEVHFVPMTPQIHKGE